MAEAIKRVVPYGFDSSGNPTAPLPAQEAFHYNPSKNRLYSGAFRAGKTMAGSHEAIKLSVDYPGNVGLICRETYPELERTTMKTFFEVLSRYENALGGTLGDSQYNSGGIIGFRAQKMSYHFNNGSMIYFAHTDNVSQFKSMEIGWFWLDEGTELIEDVYKMLISRLSLASIPANALKCFVTTNPDTYGNWVYKWFYEKQLKNYAVIETTSYDNPYLPEGYVDSLESAYDEDLQARYLKGMWGNLEGMVYKNFNPAIHVKDIKHHGKLTKYRSIDHGYTNPFVCLWGGIDSDGRYFIYNELYERQRLVSDLANDIKEMRAGDYITFADPSEAEGNATLKKAGILISPTKNDVIQGIQAVQRLLKVRGDGLPGLIIHPRCKNLIKEFQLYKWRKSDGKVNDKEEPLKLFDHACFVAGTLIQTNRGLVPIENIKIGDNVLTRKGYKKVLASSKTQTIAHVKTVYLSNGKTLTGTPNHPIYIKGKGFIPLDTLSYGDMPECIQPQSCLKALYSEDILTPRTDQINYIIAHMQDILTTAVGTFTKRYGKTNTVKYPVGITSIIKMEIHLIIRYQIWNVWKAAHTYQNIPLNTIRTIKNELTNIWNQLDHLLLNGTNLKPEVNGIVNMPRSNGKPEPVSQKNVQFAKKNLKQEIEDLHLDSVQTTANQHTGDYIEKITNRDNVPYVAQNSLLINIHPPKPVHVNVRVLCKVPQKEKYDVYNITVADEHEYYANGILVSNCDALRYFVYSTQSTGNYAGFTIPEQSKTDLPSFGRKNRSKSIPGL